jgi:LacI family repressor for deo operon, udp, cdd, tsx, nupC, and nupG
MTPVSIKDVARAARVSHSTVSRALRGSPLVNPKTAARIRRLAQKIGYLPSALGRSLKTRRTLTIGVVVNTIADPVMAELVAGIQEVTNRAGYSILLAESHSDPERELRAARALLEHRVDGVLAAASRVGPDYRPLLEPLGVPIVLINNQHPKPYRHAVSIDSQPAGRAVTEHLVSLGHRRIAYIGDRFGYQTDVERFTGYLEALAAHGLQQRPELAVKGDGMIAGGIEAMAALLELRRPPTAVFCYNDLTAIGAMRAIRSRGLRVPQDISVAGFDDLFISADTNPPLTTVRQPKAHMGALAAETLLKVLAGQECRLEVRVPGELVIRESTAPPRPETAQGDD